MANTITAFLETLVAAAGDYNKAKVGALSFLDAVYRDVKPEVARAGKTLQVYFPDVGAFTDQAATDWTPEDINPNYVDIVFNQRPGKAILIRDFEQWQTGVNILDQFVDPLYKRGQEYVNGQLAAQIHSGTGYFNTYSAIAGGTAGEVKVADVANAWGQLAANKVPVTDQTDLFVLTHSTVHQAMMTDTEWYQENLVGALIAERARTTADLGVAFNFRKLWDSQAPNAAAITGTVSAAGGTTAVTGTGTAFTADLDVGDKFKITGDATVYVVASITDDTHFDATANVTAAASKALTLTTYRCVAMHRYAIALALRPLELVNNGQVQSRLIMLKGIPFRVMLSYQHPNSGWLLSVDVGCAVKVIRPDFGIIIRV